MPVAEYRIIFTPAEGNAEYRRLSADVEFSALVFHLQVTVIIIRFFTRFTVDFRFGAPGITMIRVF